MGNAALSWSRMPHWSPLKDLVAAAGKQRGEVEVAADG